MDLFSQPFFFRFGKKDQKKKTTIGGLISVFVVIASLAYGAYLVYAYIEGSFQPTITRTSNSVDSVTQDLTYSPLMLRMHLPPSATSYTPYFTIYAQQATEDEEGAIVQTTSCANIPLNSAYTDYICIDVTSETYQLYIDSESSYNSISLRVVECNDAETCDGQPEITSILESSTFEIEILIVYQQYDSATETISLVTDRKTIPGDSTIVAWQLLEFVQTELQVDKGFLWASWSSQYFISDYYIDTIPLSGSFVLTKYSLSTPVVLQFEISMKFQQDLIQVQWIKFSTLIAMFVSIFDTLMILGIIASMSSNAMIYQEMMDMYLKEYYKQTADELQQLNKQKREQELKDFKELNSKLAVNNVVERLGLGDEQVIGTGSEIEAFKHYYFMATDPKKSDKEATAKVSDDLSANKREKPKINSDDVYRHIWHKLPDMMNASQLYSEIFRLKTALQLLFTPQQYSALGLVSRRLPDFDNLSETDYNSLNHIEKLDIMEEADNFKQPIMLQFIDRMRKSPNDATEVDKRIWESLLDHLREGEAGGKEKQHQQDKDLEILSNMSLEKKQPTGRTSRQQNTNGGLNL